MSFTFEKFIEISNFEKLNFRKISVQFSTPRPTQFSLYACLNVGEIVLLYFVGYYICFYCV